MAGPVSFFKQMLLSLVVLALAFAGWSRFDPGARATLEGLGVPQLAFLTPQPAAPEGGGEAGQSARGGNAGQGGQGGGGGGRGPGRGDREVLVTVAKSDEGIVNDRLTAIGTGQAVRSVSVRTFDSGQITSIPVSPGVRVEAGDVLLQLDADDAELAVTRARIALAEAESRAGRLASLAQNAAASSVEVETARSAVDAARVAVSQAELDLRRRTVTAPISGYLGLLSVNEGDFITTQSEIATIDDRSQILVEFFAPERFASMMEVGRPVEAVSIARPGEVFEGRIFAVDNRVDEQSRTLRVRARIENPDDRLRAGMSFEVTVRFSGETWPAVDPLAVQWDSEGAYVWLVAEGKAVRQSVAIVQRNSDRVLVKGDVPPGSLVITEGVQNVRRGAAVRILSGADEAPAGDGATDGSAPPQAGASAEPGRARGNG